MSDEDRKLDELLTGGYLAGSEYDSILGRVLEAGQTRETPHRRERSLRWAFASGIALASALAAWWLVVPRSAHRTDRPFQNGSDDFREKGPSGAAVGAIDVGCAPPPAHRAAPAGPHACRLGDTLLFQVNAAVVSGYLGAYAQRTDDAKGERIWYFPTQAGESPEIAPGDRTIVLPQGIALGPEHRAGTYRITAWVSSRPLTRAEVDAATTLLSRATFDVQITD